MTDNVDGSHATGATGPGFEPGPAKGTAATAKTVGATGAAANGHADALEEVPPPSQDGIVYYKEVRLVRDTDLPRIDFIRKDGAPPSPVALRAFRREINDVARVIRLLFQDDPERKKRFFEELHLVAASGAVGPQHSIDVGVDNLDELKGNIVDEFPIIRNKIWWWNTYILVGCLLVVALGSLFSRVSTGNWILTDPVQIVSVTLAYAVVLIPLGVSLGLFAEFVFRVGDDMTYAQLVSINPGRWKPVQRAFNTMIIAAIFAAILAKGVVQVGVGSLILNSFWGSDRPVSVAVGFVTGFAFPYVRDIVQQFRPIARNTPP